jgi:hypothetical protein
MRGANRTATLKAKGAGERQSWRQDTATAATNGDAGPGAPATSSRDEASQPRTDASLGGGPGHASSVPGEVLATPAQLDVLSVRAENVLKQWAAESIGEVPPKGRWSPSASLLRQLSFQDLQASRNCGPQTTDEIVRWARLQGVIIERPRYAGKSLSAMWQDIIARSATGDFNRAEIAEALQRSLRRKNTRIPVAFQNILVKMLSATSR